MLIKRRQSIYRTGTDDGKYYRNRQRKGQIEAELGSPPGIGRRNTLGLLPVSRRQ